MSRHPPRPAWREPAWEPQRIDFDYAFAVSATGDLAYLSSSADHAVLALDMQTGQTHWKFFTGGPVRLAPAVWNDRVYFGSDDGVLYCLDRFLGTLLWKYRPSIPDERLIGNEQLISRWPVRSGALIEKGRLYTAFGMLSPEGVFVCCLDANTGRLIWCNDTAGTHYMARPHVPGMGGVSPQGYLAICDQTLVVPCGRATPALFDKRDGRLRYHEAEGDFTGGAWTMTSGRLVFSPCESLQKEYGSDLEKLPVVANSNAFDSASLVALDCQSGREVFTLQGGRRAVLSDDGMLTLMGQNRLLRVSLESVQRAIGKESTIKHTTGHFVDARTLADLTIDSGTVFALCQAGKTVIAGGDGRVTAYDGFDGKKLWQADVDGQARELAIGESRLLVSTTSGRVYCFESDVRTISPSIVHRPSTDAIPISKRDRQWAQSLLTSAGLDEGYCLAAGDLTMERLTALATESALSICHPSATSALNTLRSQLDQAGLYGVRIAVQEDSLLSYPKYFADLVVVRADSPETLSQLSGSDIYRASRPCGGVAVVTFPELMHSKVCAWLEAGGISVDACEPIPGGLMFRRGPLEGAGQWTHQYADPGKSCMSQDQRVRLPLKALWFGGLGPDRILSRHFRTPAPLVVDGRCFVPGKDDLIAMDIYNGRILWQRHLSDLAHWPAAYRGPSLAVDHQTLYALQGLRCLCLDPASGKVLSHLDAPTANIQDEGERQDWIWEYLAVTEDSVIGSLGRPNIKREWWSKAYPANSLLFAFDKQTRQIRWTHHAEESIDSNAIAIDDGRLFLIDGLPRYTSLRRGLSEQPRKLKAIRLSTGDMLWQIEDIASTQNSLWVKDGVLISTIQPTSRTMEDPMVAKAGGGVTAYDTASGKRLWQLDDVMTCSPVLGSGTLYLPQAHNLHTGEAVLVDDPVTGHQRQFVPNFPRTCAMFSGSPHLMMARSGSLGFYDLSDRSGYYHYPIVRASCWINMIPAGGVVVVPEGSSSCVCGYNYKTSLALIPADRQNHFGIAKPSQGEVEQLHINFGAAGDRADLDGTTWFAFPRPTAWGRPLARSKYGPKIGGGKLPVQEQAAATETYARNPDWLPIPDSENAWLYACGIRGPAQLSIRVSNEPDTVRNYCVTLYFSELQPLDRPRQFSIQLQDRTVLSDFDILRDAGQTNSVVKRTFTVEASQLVTLRLTPAAETSLPPTISGMSIVRQ